MIEIFRDEFTKTTPGVYTENGTDFLFTIQEDCVGVIILWAEENPIDKEEAEREILAEFDN